MPGLEDLLQNMQWPAAEEDEKEARPAPEIPRKRAPNLQNFPWMAFAQLLGSWISGAPVPS